MCATTADLPVSAQVDLRCLNRPSAVGWGCRRPAKFLGVLGLELGVLDCTNTRVHTP